MATRFVDLWKKGLVVIAPQKGRVAEHEGTTVFLHLINGLKPITTFTGEELKALEKKGEIILSDDDIDFPRSLMEYLQRLGDAHSNPHQAEGLTVIGKECILIATDLGEYSEPMGRVLGCPDGSFIIEGLFSFAPEGKLLYVDYIDVGKARAEGLESSDADELKPWRHDFESENIKMELTEGGLRISGPKPLWEIC